MADDCEQSSQLYYVLHNIVSKVRTCVVEAANNIFQTIRHNQDIFQLHYILSVRVIACI